MPAEPAIIHRLAPRPDARAETSTEPRYPWSFCIMSTPAIRALARRIRTATALRLFLTLPDILDWKEWRMLNQAELGAELEIAQSHISTALRELLDVGVLERKGKGPRQEWRLTLDTGWRGNVAQFAAEAAKQGKTFPKRAERETVQSRRSVIMETFIHPDSIIKDAPVRWFRSPRTRHSRATRISRCASPRSRRPLRSSLPMACQSPA